MSTEGYDRVGGVGGGGGVKCSCFEILFLHDF